MLLLPLGALLLPEGVPLGILTDLLEGLGPKLDWGPVEEKGIGTVLRVVMGGKG